jgi:two-component system chemotaxis sensor kinase CheA
LSSVGQIDQFRRSFQEEAREILVELESALLALNETPGDMEVVGRVFRALHTIKGSGAMFGFDDLAAFTHKLENAFDAVRSGRLTITPELIDLTLAALDQIRAMLEEGNGVPPADPAVCAEILAKVRKLAGALNSPVAGEKAAAQPTPPEAGSGEQSEWHIRFAPGPDMMRNGANPLLLLRDLGQLGGLSVRASMEALPPLEELDPERCYISWEMVLVTDAGQDAIRDVFIFVEDACELVIEQAAKPAQNAAQAASVSVAASEADRTATVLEDKRAPAGGRRTYDKPDNATSLRVPAAKLDQLVDLVGELVTVQARLSELAARRDDTEVTAAAEEIERLTSSLRDNSMNIRMLPIRATFEKFRRLVHDLARELDKDVELTIEGAETELDKTVIDQLSEPLMHLIRNSMDHGIEPAEMRTERGKRPTANIHLSARHEGASVLIGVADDGGGIDAEAVRGRAIEKGLIAADAQLTESETFNLLFQPGFSTAKQVTDISGRGVGMDVVRKSIENLRGTVEVTSKPGEGTTVTLRLPLTLAIIDGLLVNVADNYFVLPVGSVLTCIELSRAEIEHANGKHLVDVRGELVPYIRLREQFNIRSQPPEIEQIMIVETGSGRYGFVVDQVLGDHQTVIKNLGSFYRHVQEVSGATILGNGMVALILDPERLAKDAVRAATQAVHGRSVADSGSRQRKQASLKKSSPPSPVLKQTSAPVQGNSVN